MTAIMVEDDLGFELIHYEVHGRGKPVILLHGWLGSWRYWVPTIQQLSVKYRCYALDFWGFGESGKDVRRYTFNQQVDLLGRFLDRLGMKKVVLVAHDFGAAVALQFALKDPSRVHRLLAIAPPLFESAPDADPPRLALTANSPQQAAPAPLPIPQPLSDTEQQMPRAVTTTVSAIDVQIANPLLDLFSQNSMDELLNRAIDPSSPDHPKLRAEIRKTDPQAILKGVEAFPKVNPFRDLLRVPMPVAVVLGEANRFLPWPSESLLHQLDERQQLKLVIFNECQHYPMLDQKAQFVRIIKDFLEAEDVGTLEIKEEWRRRKR